MAKHPGRCIGPDCRKCQLAEIDGRHQRAWGLPVTAPEFGARGPTSASTPVAPPPRGPCRYLGQDTGESADCPSCIGKVSLKILECQVHGTCTVLKPVPGSACCRTCHDHEPPGPAGTPAGPYVRPVKRNLLYHIAPLKDNGVWQWNVKELLKRIHQFDGRRVVSLVTGPNMDPPELVQEFFKGTVRDWVITPNNPSLGEMVNFRTLWQRVQTLDPWEITFYGHAKGVSHSWEEGTPIREWTRVLYEVCLDHPHLVERDLLDHPFTGAFKKVGQGFEDSTSNFHYSGTFYWARNRDVFSRNWKACEQTRFGSETWPSMISSPGEAACLFYEGPVPEVTLYEADFVTSRVLPSYELWKEQHQPRKRTQPGPTFSIIIPTTGRPTLARAVASIQNAGLAPGDEVLIEADQTEDFGATPRNRGMEKARGDWLLFLDDDDTYLPGVFGQVRLILETGPPRPHLFRIHHSQTPGGILWKEKEIRFGNVSTQMLVVPNTPSKLGRWSPQRGSDYSFLTSTLNHYPEGPVWREEIIAEWNTP